MQQQRQLRLGDVLDDYCPRERRLTNHAVVAMVGDEVARTRCATCDAEHEYKHAAVPRQRRKNEPAALAVPVAIAPKKVIHEPPVAGVNGTATAEPPDLALPAAPEPIAAAPAMPESSALMVDDGGDAANHGEDGDQAHAPVEEGPVHRTLIRAQLPRLDGQPPAPRPAPDFTIRQPGAGRPGGRFRPRGSQRGGPGGGAPFQGQRSFNPGDRSNGNFVGSRGGSSARPQGPGGNRPGGGRRPDGPNRNKRSK